MSGKESRAEFNHLFTGVHVWTQSLLCKACFLDYNSVSWCRAQILFQSLKLKLHRIIGDCFLPETTECKHIVCSLSWGFDTYLPNLVILPFLFSTLSKAVWLHSCNAGLPLFLMVSGIPYLANIPIPHWCFISQPVLYLPQNPPASDPVPDYVNPDTT